MGAHISKGFLRFSGFCVFLFFCSLFLPGVRPHFSERGRVFSGVVHVVLQEQRERASERGRERERRLWKFRLEHLRIQDVQVRAEMELEDAVLCPVYRVLLLQCEYQGLSTT